MERKVILSIVLIFLISLNSVNVKKIKTIPKTIYAVIGEDELIIDLTVGQEQPTADNAPLEIVEERTINHTMSAGRQLTVKLKGNITIGNSWSLENAADLDRSILEPLNLSEENTGDYENDPAPIGLTGYGGYFIFKFNAKEKTDNVYLKFVYRGLDGVDQEIVHIYLTITD